MGEAPRQSRRITLAVWQTMVLGVLALYLMVLPYVPLGGAYVAVIATSFSAVVLILAAASYLGRVLSKEHRHPLYRYARWAHRAVRVNAVWMLFSLGVLLGLLIVNVTVALTRPIN